MASTVLVEEAAASLEILRVAGRERASCHCKDLTRRMRHLPVREQVSNLNTVLRGHYAYYGIAGNFRSLQQKVHRAVERYWHKMLCSRSWAGP